MGYLSAAPRVIRGAAFLVGRLPAGSALAALPPAEPLLPRPLEPEVEEDLALPSRHSDRTPRAASRDDTDL